MGARLSDDNPTIGMADENDRLTRRVDRKAEHARPDAPIGHVLRELVGGDPEGDDERQVIGKLERCRRAMLLERIASAGSREAPSPRGRRGR